MKKLKYSRIIRKKCTKKIKKKMKNSDKKIEKSKLEEGKR